MPMNKDNHLKNCLLLYLFFFKIGCFTFGGGWAILAQMEQEFVTKRQWITKKELLEMVAVGKSVPGIMITNISMLFGYHVAGVAGGICTVLGISCPAILILSIVTVFYNSLKDNYWVTAALTGIRAAVIPIIGSAALSLGEDALRSRTAVAVLAGAFVLYLLGVSNVILVLTAVVIALVYFLTGEKILASAKADEQADGANRKDQGEK